MDASHDPSNQQSPGTSQPRVERNALPTAEDLGALFDRIVDGGRDMVRQGRDAVNPLMDQARKLGEKGESVIRQLANAQKVREALQESATVFRLASTPNFNLSQLVDQSGQVISGDIAEVYGVEVYDPKSTHTLTVAVAVQEGQHYLLRFDPATTNIIRGEDGFESIKATGPVLVGRQAGISFVIDPLTGGKAA